MYSLHKSRGDDNDALTISFFGWNYHTKLIISIYNVHHYQLSALVISASIMELIFIDGTWILTLTFHATGNIRTIDLMSK